MFVYDRVAGVIFGAVCGDALGARYEFNKSKKVIELVKSDIDKENFLDIFGDGPHKIFPGQITDDSELGLGLISSIIEKGCYDQKNVGKMYIKWYNSDPFDIGTTTRNAFKDAKTSCDIIKNSKNANSSSLSNGCLMRVFGLGVLAYCQDDEQIKTTAYLDCSMTNPDRVAIDAVTVYITTIGELLKTGCKHKAYDRVKKICETKEVMNFIEKGVKGITKIDINIDDENQLQIDEVDGRFQGFLGVALQLCFYELFHGDSYYSSIVRTVMRGGDTDTNACIVGGVLGAYYGVGDIPERWKQRVRRCDNPRKQIYEPANQHNIDRLINKIYKLIIG